MNERNLKKRPRDVFKPVWLTVHEEEVSQDVLGSLVPLIKSIQLSKDKNSKKYSEDKTLFFKYINNTKGLINASVKNPLRIKKAWSSDEAGFTPIMYFAKFITDKDFINQFLDLRVGKEQDKADTTITFDFYINGKSAAANILVMACVEGNEIFIDCLLSKNPDLISYDIARQGQFKGLRLEDIVQKFSKRGHQTKLNIITCLSKFQKLKQEKDSAEEKAIEAEKPTFVSAIPVPALTTSQSTTVESPLTHTVSASTFEMPMSGDIAATPSLAVTTAAPAVQSFEFSAQADIHLDTLSQLESKMVTHSNEDIINFLKAIRLTSDEDQIQLVEILTSAKASIFNVTLTSEHLTEKKWIGMTLIAYVFLNSAIPESVLRIIENTLDPNVFRGLITTPIQAMGVYQHKNIVDIFIVEKSKLRNANQKSKSKILLDILKKNLILSDLINAPSNGLSSSAVSSSAVSSTLSNNNRASFSALAPISLTALPAMESKSAVDMEIVSDSDLESSASTHSTTTNNSSTSNDEEPSVAIPSRVAPRYVMNKQRDPIHEKAKKEYLLRRTFSLFGVTKPNESEEATDQLSEAKVAQVAKKDPEKFAALLQSFYTLNYQLNLGLVDTSSKTIITDPVTIKHSEYGKTHDRASLDTFWATNGNVDPVDNKPLVSTSVHTDQFAVKVMNMLDLPVKIAKKASQYNLPKELTGAEITAITEIKHKRIKFKITDATRYIGLYASSRKIVFADLKRTGTRDPLVIEGIIAYAHSIQMLSNIEQLLKVSLLKPKPPTKEETLTHPSSATMSLGGKPTFFGSSAVSNRRTNLSIEIPGKDDNKNTLVQKPRG
ncbi:MAG: hypothetical protein ABI597_11725 [Gammaproteobacteria bacterium]